MIAADAGEYDMSTLVLDDRQSHLVAESDGSLEVRDSDGRLIGTLLRTGETDDEAVEISPAVARELIRRMSMKDIQWRTTEEVLAHLNGLTPQ